MHDPTGTGTATAHEYGAAIAVAMVNSPGQVRSLLDNRTAMHSLARLSLHLEWLTVNYAESFANERRLLGGLSLDAGAF